ncbi:hypothetical protein FQZ97_498910 [compost metagenome]
MPSGLSMLKPAGSNAGLSLMTTWPRVHMPSCARLEPTVRRPARGSSATSCTRSPGCTEPLNSPSRMKALPARMSIEPALRPSS